MKNKPQKAEQKAEQNTPLVPLFCSAVPHRNTSEQNRATIGNIMQKIGTLFRKSGTRPVLFHTPLSLEGGGEEQRNSGHIFQVPK